MNILKAVFVGYCVARTICCTSHDTAQVHHPTR